MTIKKVAVIGGGTMGSGIAEVAAKSGCDTIVVEIDASLAEQAQKKLEAVSYTHLTLPTTCTV